ncbi:Long chain acyl-CoA synthetase 1 [Capsicum annuum]|nr:Long chain acyl-CoA synthetase 1 [Capsicum annuum]
MTSKQEYFSKLESTKGSVKLADKTKLEIVGKGTVTIKAPKGTKFIQDVLLVPDLDQNLLSVGQMLEQDYMLLFIDKKCVVFESSGQKVIMVEMIKRSFLLSWNSNSEQVCRSSRCEQNDGDDGMDDCNDMSNYDDDECDYLSMRAQFDNADLPAGVEATVSWLNEPASSSKVSSQVSSSSHLAGAKTSTATNPEHASSGFLQVKARLGGRIRLIVSGGAPLSSEVEEFLRVTSCGFVLQGYGLTETCGLATIGHPDEMCMLGTVGPPFVFTELRLEEVPEMGYDPLGDPPRGEICVRGRTTFAGYYKKPELTREAIKDGWFHTGDIGEMMPNGVVKIIDRKKNVIKLSQGEYVALEYLEKVYGIAPIVEDIWVYGDSFKSMLVAVVVPHEGNIKKWADQNGHKGSIPELCSLQELNQYVLLELKSAAERNKLRGFENIKGVILEPQPFEFDQDVVTATMKKRRERLLKRYKVDIVDLYQRLNAAPRR